VELVGSCTGTDTEALELAGLNEMDEKGAGQQTSKQTTLARFNACTEIRMKPPVPEITLMLNVPAIENGIMTLVKRDPWRQGIGRCHYSVSARSAL
jgi:hypothetical protein